MTVAARVSCVDLFLVSHFIVHSGFGFVTMARSEDADVAMKMLTRTVVEGRVIEV